MEKSVNGSLVNANFITGLYSPTGLYLSGNNLFVGNASSGIINEYDVSSGNAGAPIKTFTAPSGSWPWGLAISGNTLFTANNGGSLSAFNITTGATIWTKTGVSTPLGLAISGNRLFVSNNTTGAVDEYDSASGNLVTSNFFTGFTPNGVYGLATIGNYLYVANNGTLEKCDLTLV